MRGISAGADDVKQVGGVGDLDFRGELAHHLGSSGDFTHGFLLDAQGDEQGSHHGLGHVAAHDAAHQGDHIVVR